MQRLIRKSSTVVAWILAGIGAVLFGRAMWISRTFGLISVDQLLVHLPGAAGAETTGAESGYLVNFLLRAVIIPLTVVVLVALLMRRTEVRRLRTREGSRFRFLRWGGALASITVLLGGTLAFGYSISLREFARAATSGHSMSDYYAAPGISVDSELVSVGMEQPRNLITIFFESTEASFSDDSLFEINMMESLDVATAEWAEFESLNMYSGSGWTMAGLVGTECGVPLKGNGAFLFGTNHNDIGAHSRSYLPGAVCIGDVLNDAGYVSVFMGGADADFASKSTFLRTHGYDQVYGLSHWESVGETEISPVWGLSDRRLMENAKTEVSRLHESGQPFHLTLLTLDIHEPLHVFEHCEITTTDLAESVQRCSAEAVAGFVEYLDENGFLQDTVVFITGDHEKLLADGVAFADVLGERDARGLYNKLWSPDPVEIQRTEIDQLSVFPTLLDLLGLGNSEGRAGVGSSALIGLEQSTGMVVLPAETYLEVIQSRSKDLYEQLWSMDTATDA